jgi:hypothetical protein
VISGAADRRVRVFDTRMPKRANCISTWQVRVAGQERPVSYCVQHPLFLPLSQYLERLVA